MNDARKQYSSTSGMKKSVETSELLKYRVSNVVPKRMEAAINAIMQKNFDLFARITMQDSNSFHATCLDTYPPCVYMNDVSHMIASTVHTYNEFKCSNKVNNKIIIIKYEKYINFRLPIHLMQDPMLAFIYWNQF